MAWPSTITLVRSNNSGNSCQQFLQSVHLAMSSGSSRTIGCPVVCSAAVTDGAGAPPLMPRPPKPLPKLVTGWAFVDAANSLMARAISSMEDSRAAIAWS